MLDTGSCVSTISESFYKKHFQHIPLLPLDEILKLECADGNFMPYTGYMQAQISSVGIPSGHVQDCIFLVVPDTDYNKNVPLLIGTNVLSEFLNNCKSKLGENFLQSSALHTSWYLAFRCMVIRERELKKSKNRLALIRSAESKHITIPANSSVTIKGVTSKELNYKPTCAMMVETKESVIPPDFDITPAVITYNYGNNGLVDVQITNVTTSTFNIPPKSILCELQPVSVDMTYTISSPDDSAESIDDTLTIETEGLSKDEIQSIKDLLTKHKDIFSTGETDIGHCSFVKHMINLTDDTPFKQRHRRIPPAMIDEVRAHIEQLAAGGIIRPSHSPWASNVVLVRKKDGKIRMCVDYRQLNNRTVRDSYALPRIEEILDTLAGSKYFTVLDMKSGYHQVELLEEHKCRTAFTVGPLGFWEFNRLPFGLNNAPATYQRLMEQCLGDLNMKICAIYLDDLIIFSSTLEEHLDRLDQVLTRLRECNLKLSPKKCKFLQTKVKYVGHIVSENGVEADPDKIEKVKNWPTPQNAEEVRQFTSFAGYYRRFVKDFSKIAKPLTDLHPNTTIKNGKKVKSSKPFTWGKEQQVAFDQLKTALSTHPVLGYADYDLPFELHTDASSKGLGAVLYQKQNGKLRVISYASRGLKRSEKNYPAAKLEFLALKWAVSEKLHDYLYGAKFTVVTDNNPLTYALSKAKLDATGHRWLSALAPYDFDIIYRPGKSNIDADVLSRYPANINEQTTQVPSESVKVICASVVTPPLETVAMSVDILTATEFPGEPMAQIEQREIRKQQLDDKFVGFWVRAVRNKTLPDKTTLKTREDLAMYRNFSSLKLIRGVLYRESENDSEKINQLVLPCCFMEEVLSGLHNDMGHPGKDRTLSLLRDRFFWPGMATDTENWVKNCGRCIRRKSKTDIRAPLVNITSSYPLELVCLDYLSLEPSQGNICNILVITDHFTRFAVAIPTRNQTAKTTADALYKEFIVRYGIPARLHSDQGANFESQTIKELCDIMNIQKSRTTPYHAAGNGMTERFNRTLISMLGTLETDKKRNWKQYVAPLVHAYNCIKHESTGYSPYMLLFGREPRLPVDMAFGLNIETNDKATYTEYISNLQQRIQETFDRVQKNSNQSREKQKVMYDRKARAAKLEVGDRVLVKILAHEGKHKLSDKWTEEIYVVTEQPNLNIPVYKVKREDGEGAEKTLHRNHLLHLGNALSEGRQRYEDPIRLSGNTDAPIPQPRKTRPVPQPRKATPIPKPRKIPRQKEVSIERNRDREASDEEDNEIVVSETTTFQSGRKTRGAELGGSEAAPPAAESISEDMSTHAQVDPMDDGDAHHPDQHLTDRQPVRTEDETSVKTGFQVDNEPSIQGEGDTEADTSVHTTVESEDRSTNLRRSSRVRKKPAWQTEGDYCMSVTDKGSILQSLLCPTTLSQLHPDIIYAIVKGVSDTI